jgi:hypothetical protein
MQTPQALFATHPLINSLALRLRPPELCGVLDLHLNALAKNVNIFMRERDGFFIHTQQKS